MQYSLGIDAGGTYTDTVLIRDTDGAIVDSNKALTTYPDPLEGFKRAEILIRPASLMSPDKDFLVFAPDSRQAVVRDLFGSS